MLITRETEDGITWLHGQHVNSRGEFSVVLTIWKQRNLRMHGNPPRLLIHVLEEVALLVKPKLNFMSNALPSPTNIIVAEN